MLLASGYNLVIRGIPVLIGLTELVQSRQYSLSIICCLPSEPLECGLQSVARRTQEVSQSPGRWNVEIQDRRSALVQFPPVSWKRHILWVLVTDPSLETINIQCRLAQ